MQKQQITHRTKPTTATTATAVTAVTAVALLTLAACGTQSGTASGSRDSGGSVQSAELPLTDVRWHVDSVTVNGKKTTAPAGASVEINTKGKASARTGCNSINAAVTVDGDTVTVGDKQQTLMACSKELTNFEKILGAAFSGKLKAKIESTGNSTDTGTGTSDNAQAENATDATDTTDTKQNARLTLTAPDGDAISLTSEEPVPLVGTKWVVNSLTDGATATSVPKGTDGKAYFTVRKDGTVEGSFGCNTFSGPAKVTESSVTFGRLSSTRKLCPGPEMTLEREVQKALEGKVTYELHHRALTLKAEAGKGAGILAQAPAPAK